MAHDDDRPTAGAEPDAGTEDVQEPLERRHDEKAESDPPTATDRSPAPEPGGSLKPERVQ